MKFLTQAQFTEMWALQNQLNTVTSGPDWTKKGQNWNLAIKSEVMEFFDYIGWKWWKEPDAKKKPSDMQARLELVDIWHFLLSSIIEKSCKTSDFEFGRIEAYVQGSEEGEGGPLQESMMYLDSMQSNNVTKVLALTDSIISCDWTWEELYKAYIGKVALNNFRQDHGYKEGTYQKIWEVVKTHDENLQWFTTELEDNFFLEKILQELSLTEGALTHEAVYHKLEIEYLIRTTE